MRLESLDLDGSSSAGGLCRLRDRLVLIVDRRAPPAEQAGVLLDALATLDLGSVFVPPAIRRKLERRKGEAR